MNKFTKLVERIESKKYFRIKSEVELAIESENEGEAGYTADSELGSIESQIEFHISEISEIRKDEYDKLFLLESYDVINQMDKDTTPEQKIILTWESEFGLTSPTTTQKMEFYHQMRQAGFDGVIIMNALKDRISTNWMSKKI
jgi:hypothetical protein